MDFKYIRLGKQVLSILALATLLSACGDNKGKENGNGEDLQEADSDTTAKTTVLNVGGQLFSIPSPVQTSMLIQKSGAPFNREVINPQSGDVYKDAFSQGLNLGVFGADLGYVTMYSQPAEQLKYLNQARKLSDALGISNAFDTQTMKRINDNMKVKDSLLVLVGVVYRSSDAFLKNNDRTHVSSLVITGGWIESLNFAAQVHKAKPNEELKMRIAYQKQALESLIKLLGQFQENEYTQLRTKLEDLKTVYDGVKFTYVYEKPETDALNKVTTINSRTDVSITDEQISQITEKIKGIRDWVINPAKA